MARASQSQYKTRGQQAKTPTFAILWTVTGRDGTGTQEDLEVDREVDAADESAAFPLNHNDEGPCTHVIYSRCPF